MPHQDKGRFAKKHGDECRPDPAAGQAVRARQQEGTISCAEAFEIAAELGLTPEVVGLAIDCAEVAIVKCQLGLYGYQPGRRIVQPAASVAADLEAAIRGVLVAGRLPCAASWAIAGDFGVPRVTVSSACEGLGIRISSCQLGAF